MLGSLSSCAAPSRGDKIGPRRTTARTLALSMSGPFARRSPRGRSRRGLDPGENLRRFSRSPQLVHEFRQLEAESVRRLAPVRLFKIGKRGPRLAVASQRARETHEEPDVAEARVVGRPIVGFGLAIVVLLQQEISVLSNDGRVR